MTRHFHPFVLALALAGCAPGAAEYTKSEAPNRLQVAGSTSTVEVAFAPGSSRLSAAGAAHLDGLIATGAILPADRVAVAAAGPPALAGLRTATVLNRLLRSGIVADAQPGAAAPPNRAVVTVARYAVTLPPCPNWSMPRANDFTNAPPSNFGCATAVNLGLMVASPGDLAGGRTLGPASGKPAVAAVDRYLDDKVELPPDTSLGPIQSSSSSGSPGGAPSSGTTTQ